MYKASSRREYERIKNMEEQALKEEREKEFWEKKEEMTKKDEGKTGKNRRRREKAKMRKGGKGTATTGTTEGSGGGLKGDDAAKSAMDDDMTGVQVSATTEDTGIMIHEDD